MLTIHGYKRRSEGSCNCTYDNKADTRRWKDEHLIIMMMINDYIYEIVIFKRLFPDLNSENINIAQKYILI